RGWYHARLIRIDFAARKTTILHTSPWQLQSPSVSPSGNRVAFLEGWSSDRGLVASEIRLLDLTANAVTTVRADEAQNVTSVEWHDEVVLRFAGWSKLGSIYGMVGTDGKVAWSRYEDGVVGTNSFAAGLSTAPDKTGFAAVREAVGAAPEIHFKSSPDADWKPVTSVNRDIVGNDFADYPEIRPIRWHGVGGLELEGLVLLPRERPSGPLPTI